MVVDYSEIGLVFSILTIRRQQVDHFLKCNQFMLLGQSLLSMEDKEKLRVETADTNLVGRFMGLSGFDSGSAVGQRCFYSLQVYIGLDCPHHWELTW